MTLHSSLFPRLVLDFDLLVYVFGQFPLVVITWICMFLSVLVVPYSLFHTWASHYHESSHGTLWSLLLGSLFLLYQGLGLGFLPTFVVVKNSFPPASCFIIILEQVLQMQARLRHDIFFVFLMFSLLMDTHCDWLTTCAVPLQVRLMMKAHSYIRENVPKVLALAKDKSSKQLR